MQELNETRIVHIKKHHNKQNSSLEIKVHFVDTKVISASFAQWHINLRGVKKKYKN